MVRRELTYDVVSGVFNNILRAAGNPSISEDIIRGTRTVQRILNEAKIFWIDEMTLDSLVNQPCFFEGFDNFEFKFPFPAMFFDFGSHMEYRYLENRDKETGLMIGGALVNDTQRIGPWDKVTNERGISVRGYETERGFPIVRTTFIEGKSFFISEYIADRDAMRAGRATGVGYNYYLLNPDKKSFVKVDLKPNEIHGPVSLDDVEDRIGPELDFQIRDDDCLDAFKIANLIVNTIDYVNAQNVVVREQRRTREEKIRVGRGRDRHLERIRVELKPYYWVEIKKSYVHRERREGDPAWTVNCKFWVRGHYRRYDSIEGREKYHIWLEPFVKGPEDAPWKNNRYEMLWKRFRPLLEHPELRRGPWAMREIQRELENLREDEGR